MSRWFVGSSRSSRSGSETSALPSSVAPPPAARELAQRTIRRQRQPRHDHLDFLLEPPAVALLELVLQLAEPLERRSRVSATATAAWWYAPPAHRARPRPDATSSNTVRSAAPGTSWSSRDTRSPGRAPDRPAVGRNLSGNHLEQARLAGAVAADEADALAGIDPQSALSNSGRWPKDSETPESVIRGTAEVAEA